MPRKTLALISGLVIVTVILFVVALNAGQQEEAPSTPQPTGSAQGEQEPVPTIPAFSVLSIGPEGTSVGPGQRGSVDVTINTDQNNVTAVQLELGYDPNLISNVDVTPGDMFPNPLVLLDNNDPQNGRYTFAVAITPSGEPFNGTGTVATITFTTNAAGLGKETQIGLLPTSLVTARGVKDSVLKSATGTVVTIGQPTTQSASPVVTYGAPEKNIPTATLAPTAN